MSYILESCRDMVKGYVELLKDDAFSRLPLSKQVMILDKLRKVKKELSELSDDV
jgi:hypothetical protein